MVVIRLFRLLGFGPKGDEFVLICLCRSLVSCTLLLAAGRNRTALPADLLQPTNFKCCKLAVRVHASRCKQCRAEPATQLTAFPSFIVARCWKMSQLLKFE